MAEDSTRTRLVNLRDSSERGARATPNGAAVGGPSGPRSMSTRPPATAAPAAATADGSETNARSAADTGVSSPADLSGHSWKVALKSAKAQMKKDRASMAAGAFAYQWFLSLFPLIIALLGIAALVHIPQHVTVSLIKGVTKALPGGAAGVLTGAISQAQKHAGGALPAVILAAAVALWSASSGMSTVEEALDIAYQVPTDRSFLKKRLVGIVLLLSSVVLGGAASALIIFGSQIGSAIQGNIPVAGATFAAAWTAVRWVVALGLISMLFSVLYWIGPNRARPRWRWVTPGSLLGTVIWAVISIGFSFYTSSFGSTSYAKTYGAFAGVALLIFWLYLTGYAILAGGEVNAAFERRAAEVS